MDNNEKIITLYNKAMTSVACGILILSLLLLTVAIATSSPLLALVACVLIPCGLYIQIQNKKVYIKDGKIYIRHFLGIITEQSILPADCGFFVAEHAIAQKPYYIDVRTVRGKIVSDRQIYIYISEYVLSKQEQEGSQYSLGEPVIILKYTDELYMSLSKYFQFNCEPPRTTLSAPSNKHVK